MLLLLLKFEKKKRKRQASTSRWQRSERVLSSTPSVCLCKLPSPSLPVFYPFFVSLRRRKWTMKCLYACRLDVTRIFGAFLCRIREISLFSRVRNNSMLNSRSRMYHRKMKERSPSESRFTPIDGVVMRYMSSFDVIEVQAYSMSQIVSNNYLLLVYFSDFAI